MNDFIKQIIGQLSLFRGWLEPYAPEVYYLFGALLGFGLLARIAGGIKDAVGHLSTIEYELNSLVREIEDVREKVYSINSALKRLEKGTENKDSA